jgi:hypothetical protein
MRGAVLLCAPICVWISFAPAPAFAQIYPDNLPIDHPAVRYAQAPFDDPVAKLQSRIERGNAKLDFREGLGYLPSLLENLGVNIDSQALVFSKTSFQAEKISPGNPRAIYFADDVAVGWVRGGDGMEIAALDPQRGMEFYTLRNSGTVKFERRDVCLQCHQGPATSGVPGIFVGSVYPNSFGSPSRGGAIVTDHRTPFEDRWGGWYVNARRGEQLDRANSIAPNPSEPETLANAGKQNLTNLPREFNPSGYLSPTSDIVALMTFEHQTQAINLITRLGWEARMGVQEERIENGANALVEYMLFAQEVPLKEPVEGVSTFRETFPKRGPRDRQGRSLRDFDLQTRLFRYPLSYTIYSSQFDALPDSVRDRVYRKLYDALMGRGGIKLERLSPASRRSIIEILADTKPGLPPYWLAGRAADGR